MAENDGGDVCPQMNVCVCVCVQAVSSPTSPFHQFGTGDLETLDKPGVRQALVDFHARYYSANLMRCVILGKESLDELESLATTYFTDVPNKRARPSAIVANPFPPSLLGRRVDIGEHCVVVCVVTAA